jgi:hypothetical protein
MHIAIKNGDRASPRDRNKVTVRSKLQIRLNLGNKQKGIRREKRRESSPTISTSASWLLSSPDSSRHFSTHTSSRAMRAADRDSNSSAKEIAKKEWDEIDRTRMEREGKRGSGKTDRN